MELQDLVIQIFMAASLIFGVTILIFNIGYRLVIRRIERVLVILIGILIFYSVIIRYLILLPGVFAFMRYASLGFDLLYISICLIVIIIIFDRLTDRKRGKYDNELNQNDGE